MVRRWPSVRARGVVLVAPLRGACARPCPLRRRAARPRASVVLRPLRRPRVPFRGGAGPPRRCPRRCAVRACSPSGCCAALRPRSPSFCAGAPRFAPPLPGLGPPRWSLRSLRGVLAPLLPRRAAACAGVARRPGGGGAVPPRPPCSRVSPPSGPAPRRSRSASPGASRCSAWGGPAVPGPRCGGARRSGGRGGAFGGRCGGRLCGALRPPAWGWGSAAAAAGPARRCGCSSPAVRRASQYLPRSAYGAMLFKEKLSCKTSREAQHVVPVYCSTYKISCEFGKTRIILPNYLWISSIDTAPYFWYALIRI